VFYVGSSWQPRHPAGTPKGGQWSPTAHDDPEVELDHPTQLKLLNGYDTAVSLENRQGRQVSYFGGECELRMPSASAVRQFAAHAADGEDGQVTFDVPVTLALKDGSSSSGVVRVTKTADERWATRAIGFDEMHSPLAAEAVQCVLESPHPVRALWDAGDLMERRRRRRASRGVVLRPVGSTWMRKVGYDDATGTLIVSTGDAVYGYAAHKSLYEAMMRSHSPGHVFNRAIRGHAKKIPVAECRNCRRCYAQVPGNAVHRCPPQEEELTPSPSEWWSGAG